MFLAAATAAKSLQLCLKGQRETKLHIYIYMGFMGLSLFLNYVKNNTTKNLNLS